MNDILNPFAEQIAVAIEIRDALHNACGQLNLALENEATKRRTAKELRQMYDEAEAEFTVEAVQTLTGSNAEKRKAELDALLVKARQAGPLARLWAASTAAAYDAADAKIGLDQCANRFRATEAAADLTAAMLRAATR